MTTEMEIDTINAAVQGWEIVCGLFFRSGSEDAAWAKLLMGPAMTQLIHEQLRDLELRNVDYLFGT